MNARFSSHNSQEFDRTRRSSIVSIESGSFDSSKDRKEELRKEMLELEQMNNIRLQTRSKGFIDSTVRWIKANPTSVVSRDLELVNQMLGQASMTPTGQRVMYRSPSIAKYRPTADESTEDPKHQMISVWKDLKKCRYLRLDDDKLDLSGVNTLVRNQMKQFGSLNSNPRTAFTKVALYSPDDTRRRQSVIPGVTSPADSAAALANVLARVASAQSE
ncbi:hypothetical protein CAPTEDRAFT_210041 [Capitella teleta]|uniref:Uncharacterized protein n=1 Tax=Capitella teleta TaxID=283909 RepID=R7V459_CAPTE|nr:hypothetical protein CAPTEDRAFT_210041 [Capitella teleta]|eukprot:ELU11136.1 hypothetical protein CAPTEDRAFT_210041 [Capitella teleta]